MNGALSKRPLGKELWIVGPKTEQTGIEDITSPEGTRFLGVLKGEELAQVYRDCHVFVLPTLEEGLALVMGVTTLCKTGVPIAQLEGLLAQADRLIPVENFAGKKHARRKKSMPRHAMKG